MAGKDKKMQSYLIAWENPQAAPFLGPEVKPRSIAEVGLRSSFLEGIALKTLYLAGKASILDMAERTRLSFEAATEIFDRLRTDQLCQVTGMTGTVAQFAITAAGRARARSVCSAAPCR